MALLAIGSILIARLLGADDYGSYALVLTVPGFLGSLTAVGIDAALVRFLAKLKAEGKRKLAAHVLRLGLTFRIIAGSIVSIICFLLADFFSSHLLNRPELSIYVKIISFYILFVAVFDSVSSTFIGLDRMGSSSALKVVMSFVRLAAAPLLILLGYGIAGALTGNLLAYALAAGMGLLVTLAGPYRELRASGNFRNEDRLGLRPLISYGFPLYIGTLVYALGYEFQSLLLAYFSSDYVIGNFAVAVLLPSTLVGVISSPATSALLPAFSKLSPQTQPEQLRRFFSLSAKYTSLRTTCARDLRPRLSARTYAPLYVCNLSS
jgi:stage V sporulation protein B